MAVRWDHQADEARFREDLALGDRWVGKVGRLLEASGLPVRIPESVCRPEYGQRFDYEDEGDLFVGDLRVEVRSLAIPFRTPRDYPSPTVRVELLSVIGAKLKAAVFIFVSRRTRQSIGILAPDFRHLRPEYGVFDSRRKVKRDWMVIDRRHLVEWDRVICYLHERRG